MLYLLPAIFVIVHSANGDHSAEFEGMSRATITSSIEAQGATAEFVTKAAFDAFNDAHEPKFTQPSAARVSAKAQARADVRNTNLTQAQRLQALIILLDLDL